MDKLWAPWRVNYVSAKRKGKKCIFCYAKSGASRDYVIFKSRFSIVMLNIYPYNNGHLLVSPLRHIRDISQLRQEEVVDLFKCLNKAKSLLQKVLHPEGFNIGINLTRAAGAGIAGHLHLHIVPRWSGDTNFMPVVSNTKIISQSLDELAKSLKNADK
ncbi:MAG: HIT domain-containing protein [Candidatus Omnitrophota bacterium]|jgi:ATP adenylyltransferase